MHQLLARLPRQAAPVALGLALCACGGSNVASQLAKPPEFKPKGQTKCSVKASQTKPLIVEWPSADRGALEAQAAKGIVLVRYVGCEMEVLRQCSVGGTYDYVPITLKEDRIRIRNADELYASIPVYAAKFESKLETAGELNVDMSIVGRFEGNKSEIGLAELEGDCSRATHFLSAITVGAFEFTAGATAQVGAGAEVLGSGADVESKAEREMINRDGNRAKCREATGEDESPPDGCGAMLRVEVVPVKRAQGTWAASDLAAPPPGWPASPFAADEPGAADAASGGTGGRQVTAGVTALVGGGVLLALGIGTGIGAVVVDADLDESCGERPCHPEEGGSVNGYYALATTSTISFISGATLGAIGGILLGTAPSSEASDEEPAQNADANLAPAIGPGSVGLSGRF